MYQRFETVIRKYGVEFKLMVTPISGFGDIYGFPVMFMVDIDGRFYANLQYVVVKWDWWESDSRERQFSPQELGNIIESWFE